MSCHLVVLYVPPLSSEPTSSIVSPSRVQTSSPQVEPHRISFATPVVPNLCQSLTRFVGKLAKQRSSSLKKPRRSKPTLPPANSPVSQRTRSGLKHAASLGDLSQIEHPFSSQRSPMTDDLDDTLRGLKANLKKRKEKSVSRSPDPVLPVKTD